MINLFDEGEPKEFVDICNVRIRPSMILFKDAFEGRSYKAKLSIQNIGNVKVSIKISPPSSYAFHIKCMDRPEELCPGLSIFRTIKYKYSRINVPKCYIPIQINKHTVEYQIKVNVSVPKVFVTPKIIDFGIIDAGLTSAHRVIQLENDGSGLTNFYVDIPKGKPHLIVDPARGKILPKSCIAINVQLVSCEEGILNSEIWIKTNVPVRIPVTGQVIMSTFEAIHPTATESFTVIDFPPTYVGVKTTKHMLIRNFSSLCNMFCVMGEVDKETMSIESCIKQDSRYKYFHVNPAEGRFEPDESKLFQFTFEPRKKTRSEDEYYLCTFLICRVRYQDIDADKYRGKVFLKRQSSGHSQDHSTAATTLYNEVYPAVTHRTVLPSLSDADLEMQTTALDQQTLVRVYLHATTENVSVGVVPTELTLTNLSLGGKETRTLELKNNSERLPIILHSKKIPYVDIDKDTIFLEPGGSYQVAVNVTPYKCGPVSMKITFDILFYDCPKQSEDTYKVIGHVVVPIRFDTDFITKYPKPDVNPGLDPKYIRSVGKYCQDLRFDTPLKYSKCVTVDRTLTGPKRDLIALPNDTTQSLRPWRSNNHCRTLFTHQPRYIAPLDTTYETTITDQQLKRAMSNFYANFLRNEAERVRQMSIKQFDPITDYTLTDGSKLLCTDLALRNVACGFKFVITDQSYMTLTPAQMNNIQISPTFINTGSIAANHYYNFYIYIDNTNTFSIRIFARPNRNHRIFFPRGDRRDIKGESCCKISVTYVPENIGYFIISLDLIVNECMFTTVTVLANVVPSVIPISSFEIEFKRGVTYHYFDLVNSLNVPISFEWRSQGENFSVLPRRGYVPEKSFLTCCIRNLPQVEGLPVSDLDLITDEVNSQRVKLVTDIYPTDVHLIDKMIEFKDIPLNQPVIRRTIIENRHMYKITYQVLNCGLGDSVQVAPICGVVPAYSISAIVIRIQMPYCVIFKTKLRVKIINGSVLEIPLEGNVVYPEIVVRPRMLQFKRILASTTSNIAFKITNTGANIVTIKFDMSEHQAFRISRGNQFWSPPVIDEITIEALETKIFYLHFAPLEMCSSTFYLPMIINGVIGPPIYSDPISTKAYYYLKVNEPFMEQIPLPPQITTVKVVGFALEPKIRMSHLLLKFEYLPQLPRLSRSTKKVIMTNNQNRTEDICLALDHLENHFYIRNIEAKQVVYCDKAIKVTLPPKEQAILYLSFEPLSYCEIDALLPIHIKSEASMDYHCAVHLTGKYRLPIISGGKSVVYSRPYPLQYTAISSKTITFKNHFINCKVSTYTDLDAITMKLQLKKKISEREYEMECVFTTHFTSSVKYCNIIKIYCTCGCEWQSNIIGCAENCLMTNYAFADTFLPDQLDNDLTFHSDRMMFRASAVSMLDDVSRKIYIEEEYHTSDFFTSYPFFPLDDAFDTDDVSDDKLTSFLLGVVDAVELWFCTQALFGTTHYIIPWGITTVQFQHADRSRKETGKAFTLIPYITGLINLAGDQIMDCLPLSPVPKDSVEQVIYLYNIYQGAINLLNDMGAYFTYLQPEFLLTYNDFVVFKKHVLPYQSVKSPITEKIQSVALFYYIAKQSWTDLLLQTYKVLYLRRLTHQNLCKSSMSTIRLSPMSKYQLSIKNLARHCNIFSSTELVLINWLEFHYNAIRIELWGGKCYRQKDINFFGKDLQDGLIFAAVTATYCPYLRPYYKSMYLNASSRDQLYHNNLTVIRTWDMLHYTFTVTPEDLMQPNCVKILMLVAYLYDILPFMHPLSTIDMNAPLSSKTSVTIKLKNTNEFPISYISTIFSDANGVFTTDSKTVVIPAKKKAAITITYHAKFAAPATAYLLLSGECRNYHYANSKCLTLTGSPDLLHPSSVFNLSFPLYSYRQLDLSIQSPFRVKAKYLMKLVWDAEISYQQLKRAKYTYQMCFINFNKLGLRCKEAEFNSKGFGKLPIFVTTVFVVSSPRYLYFFNPDVGDFMVRIDSEVTLPKFEEKLYASVSRKYLKDDVAMFKHVYVNIPTQNNSIWRIISEAITSLALPDEKKFWEKNACKPVGKHLLVKFYIECHYLKTAASFFCHAKTYAVTVDNKVIIVPKEITIKNECSESYVKLPITFHPDCTSIPKRFSLTLISTCGNCRRHYLVEFVDATSGETIHFNVTDTVRPRERA